MAIYFSTDKPQQLLTDFEARINQKEEKGKITTWAKHVFDHGTFYSHKAPNWAKLAYLKPSVEKDRLVFNIVKPADKNVTSPVYAYYHGHLAETFLNHFDTQFSEATSSALPVRGDLVSEPKKSGA
jgi:hypothetical protein